MSRTGEYWHKFEEHGWEEMSLLSEMSDVDLEMCITKRGHRAKFRKALRSLTNVASTSNTADSAISSQVDRLQSIPGEVGADPRGETIHATPSLAQVSETIRQLDRTDSPDAALETNKAYTTVTLKRLNETGSYPMNTVSEVDRTHSAEIVGNVMGVSGMFIDHQIENKLDAATSAALESNESETTETVKRLDETGPYPINTICEVDRTHSAEIFGDVMAVSGMSNDHQIENKLSAANSITNRNQVPGLEDVIESCDSNDMTVSLSTELAAVGQSCTVIDNTVSVLEGSGAFPMNRGPSNITIIKSSENTTVNQGPTHLHVAPEADQTNSPVSILKGQMEMLADSYHSKDHLYVETRAYNELKLVVEERHWATLLGKPGDGKSATAAHLLLQYTQRGYEPVFLSSPRDWKMLISDNPSIKQVVMIDDIFGQSFLDDNNNVGQWKSLIESMNRIVKERNGNLVLVCTSRRYIFKDIETALAKFACFLKHAMVDMTEEQYKLSSDEKVAIFKAFANTYNIEAGNLLFHNHYDNRVYFTGQRCTCIRCVDPPHGFPHCVELYCTNAFLRKEGIAFFRNPAQYVQREIFNFRDNDRVKFLVLLLVLHKGETFGLEELGRIMTNTTDDDKKFFQTAGVSLETAIPDIRRALTGLTNTYLKQNNDGIYSFSHHSLRETIAVIYISANPSHAIQALEFQHIIAFTRRQRDIERKDVSKVCIPFEPLAKRMISEIETGYVSQICKCDVWSEKSFVTKFLSLIEKKQVTFQESILCSNCLLVCLIQKRRYNAAKAIIKNESIGKTLHNSDIWLKSLQTALEAALKNVFYTRGIRVNLIKTLVAIRYGENRLKLDGSNLLFKMLDASEAELAILLTDNTHIDPEKNDRLYGTYFHVLARSYIDLPQFEILCQKLLQAGVDINQTDRSGVPPVFYCLTRFEDKGWNRLLCMVNHGADIDRQCRDRNIILFIIHDSPGSYFDNVYSPERCVKILTKLSELNIDFKSTDITGSNALHTMCQRKPDEGSQILLEYLLSKGVKADATNNNAVVPLMLALKNNYSIDIIKLLAKNSPHKHVDNSGQGYFHYLMRYDSIIDIGEFCEKCEILMKLGSCINSKDNSGRPSFFYMMERGKTTQTESSLIKLFQYLRERGMNPHAKDERGRNVALCALDWKIEEVLPLLCYFHSVGLDLKLTDSDGRNAVHHLFASVCYIDQHVSLEEGETWSSFRHITKREFPEKSGNILKKIYDFLTNDIGLLPTVGDKNGKCYNAGAEKLCRVLVDKRSSAVRHSSASR